MKNVMRMVGKVFDFSFKGCLFSAFCTFVLVVYSFVAYTDCYFTTSKDFQPLEKVAPILSQFISAGLVGILVFGVIGFLMVMVAYLLKKGRR